MTKKIKIALLGGGRIAEHHIKAIQAVREFRIVAICDLIETKRKYYGDKYKINTYDHYVEMLNQEKEKGSILIKMM